MKAFRFSLQAVLDNANNQKDECSLRLKTVLDQIKKAELEKKMLLETIKQNESKLNDFCNTTSFKQVKIFIEELFEKIEVINEELKKLEIIRIQRLDDLKKAKMKCSAFEKIRENKYIQYLDEIRKYEEREIEELVNYRYVVKAE